MGNAWTHCTQYETVTKLETLHWVPMRDTASRQLSHRRAACIAVILGGVLAAGAGCGGGGAAKPAEEAAGRGLKILTATTNTLKFTADQTVPGTSVARAAGLLDQAVAEGLRVRATLDAMANSPDPWGLYFTRALCTGMEQLASAPEDSGPVPQETWRDFLVNQMDVMLDNPLAAIQEKVGAFSTTVDLAQINPRLAQVWFQECVARPR
jgi:hypothetical protein